MFLTPQDFLIHLVSHSYKFILNVFMRWRRKSEEYRSIMLEKYSSLFKNLSKLINKWLNKIYLVHEKI